VKSESTFETARMRQFDLDRETLEFEETIVTLSAHPGRGNWSAFRDPDHRLLDYRGKIRK